jgi:hypothetical protein
MENVEPIVRPGLSISREANVPNTERLDSVTVGFIVVPDKVSAAAVTVIFSVPLKLIPLIVLVVSSRVAELAFPDRLAPINSVASILLKVLVPVFVDTFPVTLPIKFAEIVFAAKFPELSLATTLPIELFEVASTAHVLAPEPLKLDPVR